VIRRLLACTLAFACCFALASCNNSAAPKGDSSPSEASSAADGPSIPAAARADDEEGAKQFATYWFDTLNEATTTGETAHLKELSEKSCDVCSDFANQLDVIYGKGGHVETEGFQIKAIVMDAGMTKDAAGMLVELSSNPETIVRKKGDKPQTYKGGDLRMRMVIDRVDDHWLVKQLIPG
jgi:hypothetical protein